MSLVKCPYCAEMIADGFEFYHVCHTQLEVSCPKCGQKIKSDAKKCKYCGEFIEIIPKTQEEVSNQKEAISQEVQENINDEAQNSVDKENNDEIHQKSKNGAGVKNQTAKKRNLFKNPLLYIGIFIVIFVAVIYKNNALEIKCTFGNGDACLNLGKEYGAKKDYQKSMEYHKKACDLDKGLSCASVGDLYKKGYGVKKDYQKAYVYYKKGCDLDNGASCASVGDLYKEGYGVKKDYQMASEYYKKGCDLDNGSSCGMVGHLYKEGKGVKRDYQKASEYFKKACDLGDEVSCSLFDLLKFKN